jgi:hypothetical protein
MTISVISTKADATLQTPACHYFTWSDRSRMDFLAELMPRMAPQCDLLPQKVLDG